VYSPRLVNNPISLGSVPVTEFLSKYNFASKTQFDSLRGVREKREERHAIFRQNNLPRVVTSPSAVGKVPVISFPVRSIKSREEIQ
jgi:hypothetical protein